MRLITDYTQYYDGGFDGQGLAFHRLAFGRGGLSKREQFALFTRLGLATPPHGVVRELAERLALPSIWGCELQAAWRQEIELVVYEDEFAHAGAGKRRLALKQALLECPELFASLFMPPVQRAVNFRHVRIGRIGVWLRQEGGAGEWRSNRQDHETVLERTTHRGPPEISRAMWAIDFIPAPAGLLAVDFNTAPELVTLGETHVVSAGEILAELEWAGTQNPASLNQY